MKKKILFALITVCTILFTFCMINVSAASSGTCGNYAKWTLDEHGTLIISGTGAMTNYHWKNKPNPWNSFKDEIFSISIENGITSIGEYAFMDFNNLTSVEIANSVTTIGGSAFSGCKSITNLTIPNSVTKIGSWAFNHCEGLTSITLPPSLTRIELDAFSSCISLADIYITDLKAFLSMDVGTERAHPTYYAQNIYVNGELLTDVVVPYGITKIGKMIFTNNKVIKSISIPETVTSIADDAFYGCSNLEFVNVESLESYLNIEYYDGNYAGGSYYLSQVADNLLIDGEIITHLEIPGTVTKIPTYAFYNCTSLTDVTIPESVTSIEKNAFSGCKALQFVLYSGSKEQWNKIKIEDSTLTSKNVYYNARGTECDGISYIITDNQAHVAFIKESQTGNIVIPESVAGYPVTKISDKVFYQRTDITEITLPDSIASIGSYAFWGCIGLNNVNLGNGVETIGDYAFSGCAGLTNITIPDSVTNIGNYAFKGCTNFATVSIKSGIQSIGSYAFDQCTNIESFYISDIAAYLNCEYGTPTSNPIYYADKMYLNGKRVTNITLPDAVTKIPEYAFYNCTSLTSITIPDSVTSIGTYAFYASGITSVQIPDSITHIKDYTFQNCTRLADVTLGDSVTSIGNYAFDSCPLLTRVEANEGLNTIGAYAFRNCDALTDMEIPSTVTSIGASAFYSVGLTHVTIPSSVTLVGKHAFSFSDITELTIMDGVTGISEQSFYYCPSLSKVSIGEGIKTLPKSVFASCSKITDVKLPESLQNIGVSAFSGCSSLVEIVIPKNVVEIEENAFYNCTRLLKVSYNGYPDAWEKIYIGANNIYLEHAEKVFFFYVSLIDASGNEINRKKYLTDSVLDISDIEEKFEHVIHIYRDNACRNEFYLDEAITENLILQLRYVPNKYYATFLDEDGSVISKKLVDYGAVIMAPTPPSKDKTQQYTYTFAGWSDYVDGTTTQTNQEMVFTASYNAIVNKYTYQFIDENGTLFAEFTSEYGSIVELPKNPADKDPYTFSYWEGYQEDMVLEDNCIFTAVYKYKTYTITVFGADQTVDVVYQDSFRLDVAEVDEYIFDGYYTEENGNGDRVTDENGCSIENYSYLKNITLYPYFCHELLNKIKINGEDSTVVGSSNVVKKVYFATDKDASYLVCTVKYPEIITLNGITNKDFEYVMKDAIKHIDGYVYQTFICQYTTQLNDIPRNQKIAPFELVFDIPRTVLPQNVAIEITSDSYLIGEEDYCFDSIINGNLEITPNPEESIEIIGDDEIVLEDGSVHYDTFITPMTATPKEVLWSISDESVATVSTDGVLTPIKAGTVTLTATVKCKDTLIAEKIITIREFAKIISLKSNAGQWSQEFNPMVREYTICVENDVSSISFTPIFANGTLEINGSFAFNNRAYRIMLSDEDSNVIFVRTNASGYANSEYKITVIRYEGTKTSVSEDGNSFTVNLINIETGKTVILSLYEDGKFIETQTATYEGEALTFTTDKAYTNAKVMVWDSLANLKPVCNIETIE